VTPLLDIKWPRRLTPESEHSDDDDDDDDLADELSALEDGTSSGAGPGTDSGQAANTDYSYRRIGGTRW